MSMVSLVEFLINAMVFDALFGPGCAMLGT